MSVYVSDYNEDVTAESCYFCPQRHDLQTHHIVPQRKNGSDAKENLVIVCERCHMKLERLYDKRFYERLGLSDERGDRRSHFACWLPRCTSRACLRIRNPSLNEVDWWCMDDGIRVLKEWGMDALEATTGVERKTVRSAVSNELRADGGTMYNVQMYKQCTNVHFVHRGGLS